MQQGFELKGKNELKDLVTGQTTKVTDFNEEPVSGTVSHLASRTEEPSPIAETDAADFAKGFELSEKEKASLEMEEVPLLEDETIIDENVQNLDQEFSFWTNPLTFVLLFVLLLCGLEIYSLITELFAPTSFLGMGFSALFLLLMLLIAITGIREFSSIFRLKKIDAHKDEVLKVLKNGNCEDALRIIRTLARDARIEHDESYKVFLKRVEPHFSPLEVFTLYELHVLKHQDEKAKKIIISRSRENGVLVALSPLAIVDLVFTFLRSLRMIREICAVYGLRFGLLGRIVIYRRVLRNLVLIGITELATDSMVDALGAGFAGKLSAALGQGLAAGIYSTRLGYMTMKSVRPLQISAKVVSLSELRKELVKGGSLQKLMTSGKL